MSMSVGQDFGTKVLLRADSARAGRSAITAFRLWQLADRESRGDAVLRARLYRHGAIHAGFLDRPESIYAECPLCGALLAP